MYRFHRIRKKFADVGAIIFYIGLIFFVLVSFSVVWFGCKIGDKLDDRTFKKDFTNLLDSLNKELKKKGGNGKWKDKRNNNVIPLR